MRRRNTKNSLEFEIGDEVRSNSLWFKEQGTRYRGVINGFSELKSGVYYTVVSHGIERLNDGKKAGWKIHRSVLGKFLVKVV